MIEYKKPNLTVDAIIKMRNEVFEDDSILLIKRKNPPFGWALPGGFVDYGESPEDAVIREVKEETNLKFNIIRQLKTYGDPKRDPRGHTVSVVFIGEANDKPEAGDDASEVMVVTVKDALEMDLAFDHKRIILDYISNVR